MKNFSSPSSQNPSARRMAMVAALLSGDLAGHMPHGKSHAMKLTAAMAMPTPKRTPASTRFEPPSPKANVRPDTRMATKERPRAMVLVNAACSTLTAFSHGELPDTCAKPGTVRTSPAAGTSSSLSTFLNRKAFVPCGLILRPSACLRSLVDQAQRVLAGAVGPPRGIARDEAKPFPCFKYAELELQAVGSTFVSGALPPGSLRSSQARWEKPARTPLTY